MKQLKITQSITNKDSATLEKYFNDIAREELLTAEEEVLLARGIKNGDPVAFERLVKANLRFVISVAKQYQHTRVPLNDLINEGNLGLLKAARRYDETKGFKFISYAVWWIRQSILQSLAENSRMIRLPANKIGDLSKMAKVVGAFEQQYEREPTEEELADVLEITIEQVKSTAYTPVNHSSYDKTLSSDESSTLLDVIENEEANNIENDFVNKSSLKHDIKRILSILTNKERKVIQHYFGIDNDTNMSLEDIGEMLGISRERVRQLKNRAIYKISASPNSKILVPYLAG